MAFAGDASLRATLAPFAATTMAATRTDVDQFDARCAAAVAIAALGDARPAQALRADVLANASAALSSADEAEMAQAGWFLLRAAYYLATPRPRLSYLQRRADAFAGPEGGVVVDAEVLRARMRRLAPK
jgi:hypothetical protein